MSHHADLDLVRRQVDKSDLEVSSNYIVIVVNVTSDYRRVYFKLRLPSEGSEGRMTTTLSLSHCDNYAGVL